MAHTITKPEKALIRSLLKVGRWNNESEIIRYGLHLVAREIEEEQIRKLAPYPVEAVEQAYHKLTVAERKAEGAMSQASAYPRKGELE